MDEVKAIKINTDKTWQDKEEFSENVQIDHKGLSIKKEKIHILKEEIPIDLQDMKDITLDECENIYIVDGKQPGIYKYDRYFLRTEKIVSCTDGLPIEPESPTGITIDKDTIYVADNPLGIKPKIIAYSRINLQIKWISYIDNASTIRDIAIGPDRNIYILGEKSIFILNRGGVLVETLSSPELKDPTDIAISQSGKVYVLDSLDGTTIHIFSKGVHKKIKILTPYKDFFPSGLTISIKDELFIGEKDNPKALRTIYRVILRKTPVLKPLWTYRDTTRRIINDSHGNIYIINGSGNKLSFLEYKEVVSKNKDGKFIGTYISKRIDSHRKGNQWHRFRIEGKFPESTRIKFLYFITDNEINNPSGSQWIDALPSDASIQGKEKREGLFLANNKGRYLWFKIVLSGNIESAPVINSLSLYYPRMAYMEMLPAIYREDPASSEFLERFLSIFESLIYETDFSIAHISRYLDILGAPTEFLDWLGKWLSMGFHNVLNDEQKRNLLLMAMKLYKMRGTRQGIEKLVKVITGQRPFIVENIKVEKYSDDSYEPDEETLKWCKDQTDTIFGPSERATVKCEEKNELLLSELLYGKDPFNFCVLLKETISLQVLLALKEMIDDFSPAHTSASIRILDPWFYLDGHTYLGVNTVLNRGDFILEEAILGRDTNLIDIEECAQISRKARIGMDFKII